MLLNGIAPILSPVLGGQLLKVTDWSGIFVVLSAISIFIFILVWVGVKESLPKESRKSGGLSGIIIGFKKLLQDRRSTRYALFIALLWVSCIGIKTTTSFSLAIQTKQDAAGSVAGLLEVGAFVFGGAASPLVGLGGKMNAMPMGIILLGMNFIAFYINRRMK